MADGVVVRASRPEDFKAWQPLWDGYCAFYKESVPPVVTENTWERVHDDREPLFGLVAEAEETGKLLGFTLCVVHPGTWSRHGHCYLEDLFVAPENRGRGVGRALIEAVVAKAKENRWQRVYWQTAEDNATARALYDKLTPVSKWVIYEIRN